MPYNILHFGISFLYHTSSDLLLFLGKHKNITLTDMRIVIFTKKNFLIYLKSEN